MRMRTAVCLAGLMIPAAVHAQATQETSSPVPAPAAAPAATVSDQSSSPADIVVTAQKREQRLQDVPTPISVLTATQLERSGITNVSDLTRVTPGLEFNKNGAFAQPTIRGIGTRSTSAGDSSSVAMYVDGVYMSAQQGGFTDFNNVERIEVLKGPQGTLFGRNATGGAISVITRKPSETAALDASLAYESYDRVTAKAYVTGGITDNLAADTAVFFDKDRGFVRDMVTGAHLRDMDNWGARSKLLWEPSSALTFTLAGDYSRYRSNQGLGYSGIDGNVAGLRTEPLTAIAGERRGEVALSFLPEIDSQQWGVSLTSNLRLDDVTLTSITAYRSVLGKALADLDATNLPRTRYLLRAPTNTFTQEIYGTTTGSDFFELTGGVFLLSETAKRSPNLTTSLSAAGVTSTSEINVDASTFAVAPYGEATFHLSDVWSVIAGGRYSYERRKLDNSLNGVPEVVDAKASFGNFNYRATLQYKPSNHFMAYATASSGFKSGVFNTTAFDGTAVKPEKVQAYEVGAKSTFAGITIDGDVFYYDYKDIQVTIGLDPRTGQTGLQNAAAAHIKGAELEAQGRLFRGLTANLGVSYVHGRYVDFPLAQVLVPIPGGGNRSITFDASGLPMVRSPDWTLTGGLAYTASLWGGTLDLGSSVYYSSSFSWEPAARVIQKSYALLHANIGWTAPGGRYTVTVYGDNLTNVTYFENTTINTTGDLATYGMPRRFGVRLNVAL